MRPKTLQKLVLTGGPCAGKTIVLEVIKQQFPNEVLIAPESATMLLSGGFPLPGRDLAWSLEWQESLQDAIAHLQPQLERALELQAAENPDIQAIIFDRGLFDGAAYTPAGLKEFCHKHSIKLPQGYSRYDQVFHLESCATGAPNFYGSTNNTIRTETLEQAKALEERTRLAWKDHPNWTYLSCHHGIEGKIKSICQTMRTILQKNPPALTRD